MCFVFCLKICDDFCCFYDRAELSLCSNPLMSKLCIQGKILSNVPKFVI